jgi:hypothetical protein
MARATALAGEALERAPGVEALVGHRPVEEVQIHVVEAEPLQDGRVRLDQIDQGAGPRLALLGSYFAPGSSFRNTLVASLFHD